VQAFKPYIALNPHVRKPVIHILLNPSPKDILSERQMTILAQEFMEKFGYGDQLYRMVVRRHRPQFRKLRRCHFRRLPQRAVFLRKDKSMGSYPDKSDLACPYSCLSAFQKKLCTKLRHSEINAVYLYT